MNSCDDAGGYRIIEAPVQNRIFICRATPLKSALISCESGFTGDLSGCAFATADTWRQCEESIPMRRCRRYKISIVPSPFLYQQAMCSVA